MSQLKFIIFTIALCIGLIWITVEGWALKEFLTKPISNQTESVVIEIKRGSSTQRIAAQLYDAKMIRHPTWFVWWLKYQQKSHLLKAGEFKIDPKWTLEELVATLIEGKSVQYPVTLIAGHTVKEMLKALAESKLTGSVTQADLKDALGIKHLEGQFLPETYHFTAGETQLSILKRAHHALQKTLNDAWQTRDKSLPIDTPYEALTLASIVEKETGYAPERPTIAGVFVNRLNKGMRLQSDPTVIYGMGDAYAGDIRKKDLRTKTAYNTYRINGLPPTPIAMASKEAIEAVMHPEKTEAYYFVAKGSAGKHVFSKTLAEHNRAVRKYLLNK